VSDPRWGREPGLLWRSTPFAVVVRSRRSEETTVLGGSGAKVWELIDPPVTVADLAGRLAGLYSADPAIVASDVTATLEELERRGIARSIA